MKPQPPSARGAKPRFPIVHACFQGDFRDWHGSPWPGGDDDSPARRFGRFNRELLEESRRERQCEMLIFGVIMVVAAWPVCAMSWHVLRLFLHGHLFGS